MFHYTIVHEALELLAWMVAKGSLDLAFNGSINETAQGWTHNWESFHVYTS